MSDCPLFKRRRKGSEDSWTRCRNLGISAVAFTAINAGLYFAPKSSSLLSKSLKYGLFSWVNGSALGLGSAALETCLQRGSTSSVGSDAMSAQGIGTVADVNKAAEEGSSEAGSQSDQEVELTVLEPRPMEDSEVVALLNKWRDGDDQDFQGMR